MAKVFMICGKLCSGKSTYSQHLRLSEKAVILSIDEVMLGMLDPYLGDKHEMYSKRAEALILNKAVEVVRTDINVILDWGFWRRAQRDEIRAFFDEKNIEYELHYLYVPDDIWHARIQKRNKDIQNGKSDAYFVDENLLNKFISRFEPPSEDEHHKLIQ
ncbi:MAG: ATP-binding protein [Clostridia bacterium]|nr:ATP-binding protein [Clostridia bacterium]